MILAAFALASLAFIGTAQAGPKPLSVCPSGCAFSQLQAAIDAAPPGGTVTIAPGTFTGSLTIAKNLTLAGAGAGSTVVQADAGDRAITVGAGVSATIKNVTVTGGTAISTGFDGGGILNDGTLVLSNSAVTGNNAPIGRGGGIASTGTLTLSRTTVSDNGSFTCAGIYSSGRLVLQGSAVSGNNAISCGGLGNDGTATLVESSVGGNHFDHTTGGIANGGTMTLRDSTVAGNAGGFTVGGISNTGTLTLSDSSVTANVADSIGGISNSGTLRLRDSDVSGNAPDDCVGC